MADYSEAKQKYDMEVNNEKLRELRLQEDLEKKSKCLENNSNLLKRDKIPEVIRSEPFQTLVTKEMQRNRNKNKKTHSFHEALGLIDEEFFEFKKEVYQRTNKRNLVNALKELAQIASLCELIAKDLDLEKYADLAVVEEN